MMEFQIKIFENANIAKDLDIFGCGRDSQSWFWCIFFSKSEESRNILDIAGVIHSFPVLTEKRHHGKKQFFSNEQLFSVKILSCQSLSDEDIM